MKKIDPARPETRNKPVEARLATPKTECQLITQQRRMHQMNRDFATSQLKAAHPETNGNLLMVHNWGNPKATAIHNAYLSRHHKLYLAFKRHYQAAFMAEKFGT